MKFLRAISNRNGYFVNVVCTYCIFSITLYMYFSLQGFGYHWRLRLCTVAVWLNE